MVTPWWQALKLRQEILNAAGHIDDVQMSLFRAVYAAGAARPPYTEASYYREITHPTGLLANLLAAIAVRIGAGPDYPKARAVTRLDQAMGGGKSHACIGAWHLAANPGSFAKTDLGRRVLDSAQQIVGRELTQDLNRPHVVVMPCDNMTPGAPVQEFDGPAINLYERFLWRLFAKDYPLFERYRPYFNDKSKIADAIRAVDRPVLIIIDEVMDYIGVGLDGAGREELAGQDMAFLRALLDVANDIPNVALLVVMLAADRMALSAAGEKRRNDLSDLLERNGTPATVTEAGDFAEILRRRLFEQEPAVEVTTATVEHFMPALKDKSWNRGVWEPLNPNWLRNLHAEVRRCYPFPMLMAIASDEWSKVTGFQHVRSTIRIFAATVFALQRRAQVGEWVPLLIGPGDLPLSEPNVREAILGAGLVDDDRTIANYRALAEVEIVNGEDTDGMARRLDLERSDAHWQPINPRAAERGATFIFLASIVGTLRPGRGRGASALEVKAAASVPDLAYTLTDADAVLDELVTPDAGLSALELKAGQSGKPPRYFLSTRLTHRMLVNNLKRTVTDQERDAVLTEFTERLAHSGPFRELKFVKRDPERSPREVLLTAGIDNARSTRLIILNPSQFSLRNGMEAETLAALNAAMGLGTGKDQLPVEWASSAVFAVVNTQRRALARGLATEYLARQRALAAPEIQTDPALRETGTSEFAEAKDKLEKAVKRAYQHVLYLSQPDPDLNRAMVTVTFENDNESALDGTLVWKALAARDKVFDVGQFSPKALLHNLRETDYGRPLAEIRDAFYSAPRLPLLYGGERDLQTAIFDAVSQGLVTIVNGAGTPVAVTDSTQINVSSAGLRLAKARPAVSAGGDEDAEQGGAPAVESAREGVEPEPGTAPKKFVTFPLVGSLLDSAEKAEGLASLFRLLYTSLDEQKISYAQGTLQFVLDGQAADKVADAVRALGMSVTVRDQ